MIGRQFGDIPMQQWPPLGGSNDRNNPMRVPSFARAAGAAASIGALRAATAPLDRLLILLRVRPELVVRHMDLHAAYFSSLPHVPFLVRSSDSAFAHNLWHAEQPAVPRMWRGALVSGAGSAAASLGGWALAVRTQRQITRAFASLPLPPSFPPVTPFGEGVSTTTTSTETRQYYFGGDNRGSGGGDTSTASGSSGYIPDPRGEQHPWGIDGPGGYREYFEGSSSPQQQQQFQNGETPHSRTTPGGIRVTSGETNGWGATPATVSATAGTWPPNGGGGPTHFSRVAQTYAWPGSGGMGGSGGGPHFIFTSGSGPLGGLFAALSGRAAGGLMLSAALYPVEFVKIHVMADTALTTLPPTAAGGSAVTPATDAAFRYSHPLGFDVIRHTWALHGPVGFFRGAAAAVTLAAVHRASLLAFMDPFSFPGGRDRQSGSWGPGAVLAAVATYPLETTRLRYMWRMNETVPGPDGTTRPARYPNARECFRHIVRAEGATSLYRGCGFAVIRAFVLGTLSSVFMTEL